MKIYPNPAKEWLYVDFNTVMLSKVTVSLTDIQGRIVSQQILDAQNYHIRMNINTIPDGIYFIKVNGKNMRGSYPVIVR